MKLTIIGGGGFRVPQIYEAVAAPDAALRVDDICLYDIDPTRLNVIHAVLRQMKSQFAHPPQVTVSTDLAEALRNADFVFSAMRIGGTEGRILDERIALDLGVLGQETIGPGGLAYALRTLPHARALAQAVKDTAPEAWVINFTNPAGMITEAMRAILGNRVVGICDTPIGLMRRAARAAGHQPDEVQFDYVGLNHLGWLRTLEFGGHDLLPGLLADDAQLDVMEEARILGFDWVRALGALPNEYLFYYYSTREAVERIREGGPTRGQFLHRQQGDFYHEVAADPAHALQAWHRTHDEREASYMQESRNAQVAEERRSEDLQDGGYEEVALDLMAALVTGKKATMILNVGNDSLPGPLLVPQLREDAVVEVPCTVDRDGIHPHRVAPVLGEMAGLMVQVKASEQLLLAASANHSPSLAWRAFAGHPVVDSVAVARKLLDTYRAEVPEVGRALS